MREQNMRQQVVSALKELHGYSIEGAQTGTPDVNYIEGWIELKYLEKWPARPDTIVRIEHFTPQQRVFLVKRTRKGGNAYLLLQVSREYLLFEGSVAARIVGKSPRAELEQAACARWSSTAQMKKEIVACLR